MELVSYLVCIETWCTKVSSAARYMAALFWNRTSAFIELVYVFFG
jgi:hypothetical protein